MLQLNQPMQVIRHYHPSQGSDGLSFIGATQLIDHQAA
jgi:hypothetical protein